MVVVPWAATHLDRRPASVLDVATESLGLYVAPPVSHLELAARVPGYRPAILHSLIAERQLVGLRCLRGSAFLMPVDLLAVVVPATRDRNVRAFGSSLRRSLTTATYETWADRIEAVLEDRPLATTEIIDRLGDAGVDKPYLRQVVAQMATEARLVGVRRPSSWRSDSIGYVKWGVWLPGVDVESPDVAATRATLAHWYFDRFGPATVADFAWWSGLTKTQAAVAAEDVERTGDGLLVGSARGGDPPAGARLLPIWDTLFVTWKDRTRLISDDLVSRVYDASGNATSVVLVDGAVAGVWAMTADADSLEVRVAPFDRFSSRQWSAIEAEAVVVAAMAEYGDLSVKQVGDPPDLRLAPRNRFMSPV